MLFRHSLLYVIAKLFPGMLGLATSVIFTHLFAPSQLGTYGLILIIMTLTSSIGFNWIGVAFLRFYYIHSNSNKMIGTFFRIFLVLIGITIIIWVAAVFLAPKDVSALVLAIGIILAWIYAAFEFVSKVEIANFRPTRYLMMNTARASLTFMGAVGAAWLTREPIWAAVAAGAGMALSMPLTTARVAPNELRWFNRELAIKILRFGVPLAISMALASIVTAGTRLLIDLLDTRESLGQYTAAFSLVQNSITVIAAGVSATSYQLAVRAVESGDVSFERRQLMTIGVLLLAILMPASVGMALTAKDVAIVFVGPEFQVAFAALTPWLAAAAFCTSLRAYFLDYAFQLGDRSNGQAWVTAIAAAVALGVSSYLIPREGPLGAAIALTIATVVSCGLAAVVGPYYHYVPFPVAAALRISMCCIIMTAMVLVVPGTGAAPFGLKVALGFVAYTGAAVALNVLDSRDHLIGYLKGRKWKLLGRPKS